ncbi:MAG: hypothetical protein ACR2PS_05545 [Pseudomonadales bacterium]
MNQITGNVITAVITAIVLGVIGWAVGIFEAGSDALTEQQIETVIEREMVTDAGTTYAATLNQINLSLASMDSSLDAIKEDIDDLENAVSALAAE